MTVGVRGAVHELECEWDRCRAQDWGPGRATALSASRKFIAVAVDTPELLVGHLDNVGRHNNNICRINFLKSVVLDLKWNPLNDNVLACVSEDSPIRVWHISDALQVLNCRIVPEDSGLLRHFKWHGLLEDTMLASSHDGLLLMWHLDKSKYIFKKPDVFASDMEFSPDSSIVATCSLKTKRICLVDSVTGEEKNSTELSDEGAVPIKVIFASPSVLLCMGSSSCLRKQEISVFHMEEFDVPKMVVNVCNEETSRQFTPFCDRDLGLLYLTSKDENKMRIFKTFARAPWISFMKECVQPESLSIYTQGHTKALETANSEIWRLYSVVCCDSLVIHPISVFIPKKTQHSFSSSTVLAKDYSRLKCPQSRQISTLIPKAADFAVSQEYSGSYTPNMTAHLNNDRKFQFLSQETRPDYRNLDEREDKEAFWKVEKSPEERDIERRRSSDRISFCEIAENTADPQSVSDGDGENTASETNTCSGHLDESEGVKEGVSEGKYSIEEQKEFSSQDHPVVNSKSYERTSSPMVVYQEEEVSNKAVTSTEVCERSSFEEVMTRSPKVERTLFCPTKVEEPCSSGPTKVEEPCTSGPTKVEEPCTSDPTKVEEPCFSDPTKVESSSSSGTAKIEEPLSPGPTKVERLRLSSSPMPEEELDQVLEILSPSTCTASNSRTWTGRSSSSTHSDTSSTGPKCRAVLEPLEVETNPFRQFFEQKEETSAHESSTMNCVKEEEEEITSGAESDTENEMDLPSTSSGSGTDHCRRLLENTVTMLERQLGKADSKIEQLERLLSIQQKDAESLRFEIAWKDERIEFLQKTLVQMETSKSKSPL